jgi:hypothetical protein
MNSIQSTKEICDELSDDDFIETLQYLWGEYEYRHNLIWNLIFRFTGAIVLLSIIPYIQVALVEMLNLLLLIPPFLGFVLAVFSLPFMWNELKIFGRIKKRYRLYQNCLKPEEPPLHPDEDECRAWPIRLRPVRFRCYVIYYCAILVVLSFINFIVVAYLIYNNELAPLGDPESFIFPIS